MSFVKFLPCNGRTTNAVRRRQRNAPQFANERQVELHNLGVPSVKSIVSADIIYVQR